MAHPVSFVSGIDQERDLEALRSRFQSASQTILSQIAGNPLHKPSETEHISVRSPPTAYHSPSTVHSPHQQRGAPMINGNPSAYRSEEDENEALRRRFQAARQGLWRPGPVNPVVSSVTRGEPAQSMGRRSPSTEVCTDLAQEQDRERSPTANNQWSGVESLLTSTHQPGTGGAPRQEMRRPRSRSPPIVIPSVHNHESARGPRAKHIFAHATRHSSPVHGGVDYLATTQTSRTRARLTAKQQTAQREKQKLKAEERAQKLVARKKAAPKHPTRGLTPAAMAAAERQHTCAAKSEQAPSKRKGARAKPGERARGASQMGFSLKDLADMEVTTTSSASAMDASKLSDHRMSVLRNTAGKEGAMLASRSLSTSHIARSKGDQSQPMHSRTVPRDQTHKHRSSIAPIEQADKDTFVQSALAVAQQHTDTQGQVRLQQLVSVMPAGDGFLPWLLQGRQALQEMSLAQLQVAATVYQEQLRASSSASLASEAARWEHRMFAGVDQFTPTRTSHTQARDLDGSGTRGLDRTRGLDGSGMDGSGTRGLDGSGMDGSGTRGLDGSGMDGSGTRGLDGSGMDGSGTRGLDGSGMDGSGTRGLERTDLLGLNEEFEEFMASHASTPEISPGAVSPEFDGLLQELQGLLRH